MPFRADWACGSTAARASCARPARAPRELPFVEIERASPARGRRLTRSNLYAGARIDGNDVVVIGRRGGPEFLDSELARLGHLVGLAASLARP